MLVTTVSTRSTPKSPPPKNGQRAKRPSYPTTIEAFLRWDQPEDGYKYEWNNGTIEKSAKMITPAQLYLVDNLSTLLEKAAPPIGGRMICEVQNKTTDVQVRIPDVAYYTKEEIRKAADKKYQPVTSFAIEIISDHDKINKVYGKIEEYFQAGVKVVWMIFPEFEKVHVFTSPEDVKICKGKTLCSAESVIPGFVISATDLFKKG